MTWPIAAAVAGCAAPACATSSAVSPLRVFTPGCAPSSSSTCTVLAFAAFAASTSGVAFALIDGWFTSAFACTSPRTTVSWPPAAA